MAVYNINGRQIVDLSEAKTYSILNYNVGNFDDAGGHDGYSGNDLEDWITKWVQFFGEYSPDVCFLQESRTYVDSSSTELSKNRIYAPLYKSVSNFNPSVSWGVALLSDVVQNNVQSGLYTTRVSAESKYLYATITLNGVDIFAVSTHLNHTAEGQEQASINARTAQMAELITLSNAYDNVIIAGDFNIRALSEMAPFVTAGYTLGNGGVFGDFDTYSLDDPRFPCDNILIKGDKLRLKDFEVFEGVTTHDHLVTMAKIQIG